MKRLLAATAAALVLVATVATPVFAQDKNCDDFDSQAEAQRYFRDNGGSPTNNVDGLDANGNGVACENNTDFSDPARDEEPAGMGGNGGGGGGGDNGGGGGDTEMPETDTVSVEQGSGSPVGLAIAGVFGLIAVALFSRKQPARR